MKANYTVENWNYPKGYHNFILVFNWPRNNIVQNICSTTKSVVEPDYLVGFWKIKK